MPNHLKRAKPRAIEDLSAVRDIVRGILESVRAEGEAALRQVCQYRNLSIRYQSGLA